jgi:hypothetical protein
MRVSELKAALAGLDGDDEVIIKVTDLTGHGAHVVRPVATAEVGELLGDMLVDPKNLPAGLPPPAPILVLTTR